MARSNPFDLRRASQLSNRRSREQLTRKSVMNESYDPEKEDQSGKEQLKAAAEDLKAAAAGKIEDLREPPAKRQRNGARLQRRKLKRPAGPPNMPGSALLQKDRIG